MVAVGLMGAGGVIPFQLGLSVLYAAMYTVTDMNSGLHMQFLKATSLIVPIRKDKR